MRVTWVGRRSICLGQLREPGRDYDLPDTDAADLLRRGIVTRVAPAIPTPPPRRRSSLRAASDDQTED